MYLWPWKMCNLITNNVRIVPFFVAQKIRFTCIFHMYNNHDQYLIKKQNVETKTHFHFPVSKLISHPLRTKPRNELARIYLVRCDKLLDVKGNLFTRLLIMLHENLLPKCNPPKPVLQEMHSHIKMFGEKLHFVRRVWYSLNFESVPYTQCSATF